MQPTGIQPAQLLMEVMASAKDKIGQEIARIEFSQQLHEQHQLVQQAPLGPSVPTMQEPQVSTSTPAAASRQAPSARRASTSTRLSPPHTPANQGARNNPQLSGSTRDLALGKWRIAQNLTFTDPTALDRVLSQYQLAPSVNAALGDALDGQGQIRLKKLNQILARVSSGTNDPVPEGTATAADIQSLLGSVLEQKQLPAQILDDLAIRSKAAYDFGEFRQLMQRFVEQVARTSLKQANQSATSPLPQTPATDAEPVKPAADAPSPARAKLPNHTESLAANLIPSFLREHRGSFDPPQSPPPNPAGTVPAGSGTPRSEATAGDDSGGRELPENHQPPVYQLHSRAVGFGWEDARSATARIEGVGVWPHALQELTTGTISITPPKASPSNILTVDASAMAEPPAGIASDRPVIQIVPGPEPAALDPRQMPLSSVGAMVNASISAAAAFRTLRAGSAPTEAIPESHMVEQTITASAAIPVVDRIAAPVNAGFIAQDSLSSAGWNAASNDAARHAHHNPSHPAMTFARSFFDGQLPEASLERAEARSAHAAEELPMAAVATEATGTSAVTEPLGRLMEGAVFSDGARPHPSMPANVTSTDVPTNNSNNPPTPAEPYSAFNHQRPMSSLDPPVENASPLRPVVPAQADTWAQGTALSGSQGAAESPAGSVRLAPSPPGTAAAESPAPPTVATERPVANNRPATMSKPALNLAELLRGVGDDLVSKPAFGDVRATDFAQEPVATGLEPLRGRDSIVSSKMEAAVPLQEAGGSRGKLFPAREDSLLTRPVIPAETAKWVQSNAGIGSQDSAESPSSSAQAAPSPPRAAIPESPAMPAMTADRPAVSSTPATTNIPALTQTEPSRALGGEQIPKPTHGEARPLDTRPEPVPGSEPMGGRDSIASLKMEAAVSSQEAGNSMAKRFSAGDNSPIIRPVIPAQADNRGESHAGIGPQDAAESPSGSTRFAPSAPKAAIPESPATPPMATDHPAVNSSPATMNDPALTQTEPSRDFGGEQISKPIQEKGRLSTDRQDPATGFEVLRGKDSVIISEEEGRVTYQNSVELLTKGAVDGEAATARPAPVTPELAESATRQTTQETGTREPATSMKGERAISGGAPTFEESPPHGQGQGQQHDHSPAWFRNDVPTLKLSANPAADPETALFSSYTSSLTVELAQRIQELHRQNRHELTLELQPEHLGRLRIRIGTDDHQVSTLISTESEQIKELLTRSSALLRQELASQGLVLEKLQIDVNSQATAHGQPFDRHGAGTRRNGKPRQEAAAAQGFPEPGARTARIGNASHLISLFV